jgi:hypothetical protein
VSDHDLLFDSTERKTSPGKVSQSDSQMAEEERDDDVTTRAELEVRLTTAL